MKVFDFWTIAAALLFASGQLVFARPVPKAWQPVPMKCTPLETNSAIWHTVEVSPKPQLPKIHFYDKLNPLWWLENADDPTPPNWYLPADKDRMLKWRLRNPFHNFDFYVIGVADRHFVRSGRWPERNSNPGGGWDFEIARRRLALLPFVSYERNWITFYLGWRERGAFGAELRFHTKNIKPGGQNNAGVTIR
jgi:hypothetical protein